MSAHRPLIDKSVGDLVETFNEKCLAARQLGPSGAIFDDDIPSTFLKKPASAKAIEALERKVKSEPHNFTDGLPEEYVQFLKITNGFYADGNGASNDEVFRPVSEVKLFESEWSMEMLGLEFDNCEVAVDLPDTTWALQLGAGGDEGEQLLLPPATTKTIVQVLQQAHAKSTHSSDKERIEEVAAKLAGSFDKLSEVQHLIIRMYHWDTEIGLFSGFKHLLENFVQKMGEDAGNGHDDDNEDEEEDEDLDDAKNRRKQIPEGKPNILKNLKFLFTGTFDLLDRDSSKKTVEKYGGKVISNLEKTDYIVLGTQCGPKKLDTIKEKNLRTITEEGFFQLLEGRKPKIGTQEDLAGASTKYIPPKPAKKDQGKTQKAETAAEPAKKAQRKAQKAEPATKPAGAAKSKPAGKAGNSDTNRKAVPEGKSHALVGMKVLFTGTMKTMDRKTANKAAEKHGAEVITKLADTDLIVLGTAAGPNKLKEIEDKGYRTCTEDKFLAMVGDGPEEAGEDEEEEEVPKGKKRGAPAAATEDDGGKGKGRGRKSKKTA